MVHPTLVCIIMDSITLQPIFIPNRKEKDVVEEVHLYLIDYIHILEKKLRSLKREVKENPDAKVELKGQMSSLRKMRRRAEDVLDDLESNFHTNVTEEAYEDSE